jgi:hypothetical protein
VIYLQAFGSIVSSSAVELQTTFIKPFEISSVLNINGPFQRDAAQKAGGRK